MSSLFVWWSGLLSRLLSMGCALLRPALTVEGVRYRPLRQLAEGGFSTVHLARDTHTGRKVVLKRIICHSIEDQNLARLEAEMMKRFSHENIIRLLGWTLVGEADLVHNRTSEAVLVLPFYPRGTLAQELDMRAAANHPLREPELLRLFLGVCAAVRELHAAEPVLAHRDIKPHNVLLDDRRGRGGGALKGEVEFTPVLMDLGSVAPARVRIRSHRDAQFLQDTAAERSSMTYRAPELFQVPSNCDIDEKTDIWSLGCLLYALMHYQSPFDSVYERGDSVALAVQSGSITFPPNSSYSSDLRQLVTRLLNLEWSFRPSIESVMEQVQELLTADQQQQQQKQQKQHVVDML